MLRTLRNTQREDEGFTLIELLVVVIIIGILAAIAIPVFLNQREKARNSSANSDLRNLITAQEGTFTEEDEYSDNLAADGALDQNGYTASSDVWMCVDLLKKDGSQAAAADTAERFTALSWHPGGTNYYYYDSAQGQIIKGGSVDDAEYDVDGDGTADGSDPAVLSGECLQVNPAA